MAPWSLLYSPPCSRCSSSSAGHTCSSRNTRSIPTLPKRADLLPRRPIGTLALRAHPNPSRKRRMPPALPVLPAQLPIGKRALQPSRTPIRPESPIALARKGPLPPISWTSGASAAVPPRRPPTHPVVAARLAAERLPKRTPVRVLRRKRLRRIARLLLHLPMAPSSAAGSLRWALSPLRCSARLPPSSGRCRCSSLPNTPPPPSRTSIPPLILPLLAASSTMPTALRW